MAHPVVEIVSGATSVSVIDPESAEPESVSGIEPKSVSGIEPKSVSGFDPQTVHSLNGLIFGGYLAHHFGDHPEIRPGKDQIFFEGFRLYPGAKEVSNLLKIRRLPVEDFWKVAEEDWEKQENKLQKRVDSCKAQKITLNNEIYQLVGFAAAFQGLLITAAAQGTHLTCTGSHWWVIVLSIFGTVVTGVGVWNKVLTIRVLQESIDRETPAREDYTNKLQRLKQDPTDFSFAEYEYVRSEAKSTTKRSSHESIRKKFWPLSYATYVFFCLVVFGVLCVLSLQFVLCH